MKLTIEALAAYLNQLYSGKATEQSLMMKLVEVDIFQVPHLHSILKY